MLRKQQERQLLPTILLCLLATANQVRHDICQILKFNPKISYRVFLPMPTRQLILSCLLATANQVRHDICQIFSQKSRNLPNILVCSHATANQAEAGGGSGLLIGLANVRNCNHQQIQQIWGFVKIIKFSKCEAL